MAATLPDKAPGQDWSIADLAVLWTAEGGSEAAVVVAVAVAMAESGGDPSAISPTADYGLWQINRANFAAYGLTTITALDPVHNVRVAIAMSDDGGNFGPWCTAWAHPAGNCGHYLGPTPQDGSDAGNWVPRVQAALPGVALGYKVPPPPADYSAVTDEWKRWQNFLGPNMITQHQQIDAVITEMKGLLQ